MQDESSTPTKVCTRCKMKKPATLEYFSPHSGCRDGLRGECKPCRVKTTREWMNRNPERVKRVQEAHYAAHREELIAKASAYYYKNRELRLAQAKDYAKRNPDRVREYHRRGYERHREEFMARGKAWLSAHPEQRRAYTRNRRARIKELEGSHTGADVLAQYERQNGRCFWCDGKVGNDYHADHVVPVSLGGSNGPENIVVSCPACNMSKSAKHPMDWAGCLL